MKSTKIRCAEIFMATFFTAKMKLILYLTQNIMISGGDQLTKVHTCRGNALAEHNLLGPIKC